MNVVSTTQPSVSILIPVRNSESAIQRCVMAARASASDDMEIIVMDKRRFRAVVAKARHQALKCISLLARYLGAGR